MLPPNPTLPVAGPTSSQSKRITDRHEAHQFLTNIQTHTMFQPRLPCTDACSSLTAARRPRTGAGTSMLVHGRDYSIALCSTLRSVGFQHPSRPPCRSAQGPRGKAKLQEAQWTNLPPGKHTWALSVGSGPSVEPSNSCMWPWPEILTGFCHSEDEMTLGRRPFRTRT